MRQKWERTEERYFGIGVYQPTTAHNIGTLWRSALILGAKFIFIVDGKYSGQSSDTLKTWSKIPFYRYDDFDHLYSSLPYSAQLVGVEMAENSSALTTFVHPHRAVYLLGAENNGIPAHITSRCHHLIQLPGEISLNVAVCGSIVMYDRLAKTELK
ncbi:MAG: RNA methyltransferase [Crocinitomicaceae bacterium]|nr:RNA methyltransferase [Crocinitomicaceae bacterium]MBK8924864.1 RNA methyltransferase [Crocinitomicaceae bacterium]